MVINYIYYYKECSNLQYGNIFYKGDSYIGKKFYGRIFKNGDRIHAINYGNVFLNVYKDGVSKSEFRDAYIDWNLNNYASSFTYKDKESNVNPLSISSVVENVEKGKTLLEKAKEVLK